MFGFLGFLLIIFLLIIFIGFTILGNILRVLFGIGKHPPYQNRTSTHQKQNTCKFPILGYPLLDGRQQAPV